MNAQDYIEDTNLVTVGYYHIITVSDRVQIIARVGKKWEFDDSCKTINEMLDNGLIDPPVAQGWANQQNGLRKNSLNF